MPSKRGTQERRDSLFILALGVLATSFASIFVRLSSAPPLVIAFYRLLLTFLILTPPVWCRRAGELLKLQAKDAMLAALAGFFLAWHFLFFISSLFYTTVAVSVVLVSTHPLFVMVAAPFFLKEKVPRGAVWGCLLALAGTVIVGLGDYTFAQGALLGDMMALLGALMMAAYLMIGRKLRQTISNLTYTYQVYGTAALVLGISGLFLGTVFGPYPGQEYLIFLALAVIPTLCGHSVFNWALQKFDASLVSLSILGEPLIATILALIFFRELPSASQVAGGVMILLGLYAVTRSYREQPQVK